MNPAQSTNRRGSLLVIAAGLAAIVASLALAFLARASMDAESSRRTTHAFQARLMLAAACQYIQETSRVGWDLSATSSPRWQDRYPSQPDPDNRIHEETFGWVDVRNGQIGPLTLDYDGNGDFDRRFDTALVERSRSGISPDRPAWPAIGGLCRAPMEVWERPPYAIALTTTPNAIVNQPSDPAFGLPLLRNPDPQPAFSSSAAVDPTSVNNRWREFQTGNPLIRPNSRNLGWFRVYRDGPATFVITVGTGATRGFKDWPEVEAYAETAAFSNTEEIFNDLLGVETRLWYRVEWSAAVSVQAPLGSSSTDIPRWRTLFNNGDGLPQYDVQPWTMTHNHGGTIAYIQRLRFAPDVW